MQELLGRTFSVGEGRYRVVDVRRMSGEAMIYAEEIHAEETHAADPGNIHTAVNDGVENDQGRHALAVSDVQKPAATRKPRRAAFHYTDIAALFSSDRSRQS